MNNSQNGQYKQNDVLENGNGNNQQYERLTPHDRDAEEALLGSLLIDPDVIYSVTLEQKHFYFYLNGVIYRIMKELAENNQAVDIVTVNSRLLEMGLEELPFLLSLPTAVPTSVNFKSYESIIMDTAARREIIRAAQDAANLAFEGEIGINSLVSDVSSKFGAILDNTVQGKLVSAREAYQNVLNEFIGIRSGEIERNVLATGFLDLDRLLDGGLGPDMIVIAGRPGMGKSTLEMQIRMNVVKQGKRAAHFNLEMSQQQLRMREISGIAKVPFAELKNVASISDKTWQDINKAIGQLAEYENYVDTMSWSADLIASRARAMHMEKPLDMISVDYIGLVSDNKQHYNKNLEIAEISRKLKRLSVELNIPVIVIAQLSRAVEQRAIKKPILSDLRDSGAIEQDADMVFFLYRDEYYNVETDRPNICEIDVAKNRHGATGKVDLYFQARTYRFMNLSQQKVNL